MNEKSSCHCAGRSDHNSHVRPSATQNTNRSGTGSTTGQEIDRVTQPHFRAAATRYNHLYRRRERRTDCASNEKGGQESLSNAIKNNDAATMDQVTNTLGQSMAQVMSIKAKADAAFYRLLTAEQQTKLSERE